jgi:hypothetical protein
MAWDVEIDRQVQTGRGRADGGGEVTGLLELARGGLGCKAPLGANPAFEVGDR